MLTYNVVLTVLGALVVAGMVSSLSGKSTASYGALTIAALAGGLVAYAAKANFGLPDIFSPEVKGQPLFVFWVLFGNFWGALLASMTAGPEVRKGSGVR